MELTLEYGTMTVVSSADADHPVRGQGDENVLCSEFLNPVNNPIKPLEVSYANLTEPKKPDGLADPQSRGVQCLTEKKIHAIYS